MFILTSPAYHPLHLPELFPSSSIIVRTVTWYMYSAFISLPCNASTGEAQAVLNTVLDFPLQPLNYSTAGHGR